ncbi:hypothetical protein KP509_26G024800 [Ceratopteris richardii]|uniref:ARC6 IMS domain-containing protein n=1 Tax=Ceratopteris richardii TaxID=49495 RepID=A0A8T2RLU4_CERRI|nr:hypothetical protein KP509_26G024800 [Ceratopteris richardii]
MISFANSRCLYVSRTSSFFKDSSSRSSAKCQSRYVLLPTLLPSHAGRQRKTIYKDFKTLSLYLSIPLSRNQKLREQWRPKSSASSALASSALSVSERTISLPIDFYQILGADTHFLADAIVRAYESKVNNLPADGFTQDAISARKEILWGACETLTNPDLRGEYNESLKEDAAGTLMVDVPFSKVPGALCLLQESGEIEIVLEVGKNLLKERLMRSYRRDIILAMALAYVELSREAMAETPPKIMQSCELLERSLKLLQEEGGSNLAPELQKQIDHTIQHLNPRCLLELLSLPLGKEHEERREEGKSGVEAILWTVGEAGAFLPIPGFSREGYLREAFSRLTAAEQVAFFTATPSNIPAETSEVYAVALAHIAEGFVSKKPHMIQEADTLFAELQQVNGSPSVLSGDFRPADQKLAFSFERGMCALLLGEIDDCRAWLGLDDADSPYREQSVTEFVVTNSPASDETDFLPGLCKLLETWLGGVLLPSFREFNGLEASLRDYFDDQNVLSYLEKLKQGGSPLAAAAAIVQLGAGAGAALDSVKTSALETLQKVFPLRKGNHHSFVDNDAMKAQSEKTFVEHIDNKFHADKTSESYSDNSGVSSGRVSPFGTVSGGETARDLDKSQQISPLQIASASILLGALCFGGWRILCTGKSLWKTQISYSEQQTSSSSGSTLLSSIDVRVAEKIVRRWQAVKSMALGRDHDLESLSEVLDGKMLEDMSGRAKDAQRNGWYWDYKLTNLSIDSVTTNTNGRGATVEATLCEGAKLFDENSSQALDSYQSSYTIRYELSIINGRWKITSGTVLQS